MGKGQELLTWVQCTRKTDQAGDRRSRVKNHFPPGMQQEGQVVG